MKRIFALALSTLVLTLSDPAQAQQQQKIPRVGYLAGFGDPTNPGQPIEAFRQGLRELGYIEGKNIHVEYRYVEEKQERVPRLVEELLQLKVDVLVIPHTGAIYAAKQASTTVPIVIVTNVDPVATGIVDSLARPGANITGVSRLTRELGGKRLELLKEVVPKVSRVAVLWDADDEGSASGYKEYEAAARALRLQLHSLRVHSPSPDLAGAFQTAAKAHDNALIMVRGPLLRRYAKQVADLSIKNHLPCMCEGNDSVEAGGLMSYSTSDTEPFHRAAWYVDKILKGAKPADLPVEQPTKFEFIINLKTAKQIGVTIPQSVLYRADRVIR